MKTLHSIIKYAIHVGIFVLLYALQTMPGIDAELLPVMLVIIAAVEGRKCGAIFGIFAGLLKGSTGNLGILYALPYFALGYLVGMLYETRLRVRLYNVLPMAFASGAIFCAAPALGGAFDGAYPVLLSAGITLAAATLYYPLAKRLCRRNKRAELGRRYGL